jgi:hypothetical protein
MQGYILFHAGKPIFHNMALFIEDHGFTHHGFNSGNNRFVVSYDDLMKGQHRFLPFAWQLCNKLRYRHGFKLDDLIYIFLPKVTLADNGSFKPDGYIFPDRLHKTVLLGLSGAGSCREGTYPARPIVKGTFEDATKLIKPPKK